MDDLRGRRMLMDKLSNALEVLTNLSYMIRVESSNPNQVLLYLNLIDSQILNLADLVKNEPVATNGAGKILAFGGKFSPPTSTD